MLIKNSLVYRKIFLLLFLSNMINAKSHTLQTVKYVDLTKYAGKWFEIASFPQRFQKGCNCTTAEYTATNKGYIIVENRCNKNSVNGKQSYIKGKAFVEKNSGNAKLKVQFFWPFKGKYWIIDLADDYSFAVISHPNKKYLWITCCLVWTRTKINGTRNRCTTIIRQGKIPSEFCLVV